jgi:hypothetical protein
MAASIMKVSILPCFPGHPEWEGDMACANWVQELQSVCIK